jgi:hypothetical protein
MFTKYCTSLKKSFTCLKIVRMGAKYLGSGQNVLALRKIFWETEIIFWTAAHFVWTRTQFFSRCKNNLSLTIYFTRTIFRYSKKYFARCIKYSGFAHNSSVCRGKFSGHQHHFFRLSHFSGRGTFSGDQNDFWTYTKFSVIPNNILDRRIFFAYAQKLLDPTEQFFCVTTIMCCTTKMCDCPKICACEQKNMRASQKMWCSRTNVRLRKKGLPNYCARI